MTTLANMLTSFKIPERTPEEWAEWNAALEAEERESKRKEVHKRILNAHIPEEFINAFELEPEIEDWIKSKPTKGLLLQGLSGRGKTYQACAVLKRMANDGRVLFSTFTDIKHAAKDCFQGLQRESEAIAQYTVPYCLLIDDVGKEQITEWSLPIFFEIVKKRGEKLKPTIITTNNTGKQLLSKFTVNGDRTTADAILSRFSAYKIIKIEGDDRRKD